jgi:hypothetical protein
MAAVSASPKLHDFAICVHMLFYIIISPPFGGVQNNLRARF